MDEDEQRRVLRRRGKIVEPLARIGAIGEVELRLQVRARLIAHSLEALDDLHEMRDMGAVVVGRIQRRLVEVAINSSH